MLPGFRRTPQEIHRHTEQDDANACGGTAWLGRNRVTHERDRGNLESAIDDYHLYSEFERSGLETLRTLAQLGVRYGQGFLLGRPNRLDQPV